MARTLQQLKESVDRMIQQQGADAPVAAFIFTGEDVFVMDDNGDQVTQPREIAEKVLNNLDEYDYLYTEIFDCIDNELRGLKVIVE
jgi:predicted oxidoreductase